MIPISRIALQSEHDVVASRQVARQIAERIGFDVQDQTRIATATSELARNAQRYAHGGAVEIGVELEAAALRVVVTDRGPGIANVDSVLRGRYVSTTGMGLGLVGVQRLMGRFDLKTGPTGTVVSFEKDLPRRVRLDEAAVASLRAAFARDVAPDALAETERLNRELFRALDEIRAREGEVEQLSRELEETNRGVVALYAELDEQAAALQRASEAKSRFFSGMSHELRTPLNSIVSLARLLLDRVDGELSHEQERQVSLIRHSALELSEIVDDLLDLAKVEAGKVEVKTEDVHVHEVFGALRGALKPLVAQATVALSFDDASDVVLHTDRGKLTQILRNFVSNALKYTTRGEVRVWAESIGADEVRFAVRDTGIGIAAEDQERIFEEFTQIESPLQRRVKGTGLGLPLSRRLAELLRGRVRVESTLGQGSTFFLEVPRTWTPAAETGHV